MKESQFGDHNFQQRNGKKEGVIGERGRRTKGKVTLRYCSIRTQLFEP